MLKCNSVFAETNTDKPLKKELSKSDQTSATAQFSRIITQSTLSENGNFSRGRVNFQTLAY